MQNHHLPRLSSRATGRFSCGILLIRTNERAARKTADEQRERERKQRARLHTANGRERKAAKRRREVETFMKVAETVIVKKTPWQVAGAALEQVNKLRKLDRDFCFDDLKTCDPIYRVVRIPRNWSRLTSLR
jgi:hypothetical protein